MINLIYCEILKLKGSKIIPISILGVLSTPLLMFVACIQTHIEHPEKLFTLSDIFSDSILYIMLISNIMIYIAITAFIFSREYTESTLKTILAIPVSRSKFILSKFAILFLWTTSLIIITWIGILLMSGLYSMIYPLDGFGISEALRWLPDFIKANTLMYLTITPFAFIATKTKGFVAPVITSAIVVMGSAAVSNQKIGALYPWTSTYFVISGKISETGFSHSAAAAVILFVFSLGILSTAVYFKKEDIK